jgi:hypothetical protein
MTMTYHVHSVEQDMASKWYARVVLTEDEAQFFKFDHFPTMEEIQAAAADFVDARTILLERARDLETGQYIGDDPNTPDVNEAWVEVTDDGAAE